LGMSLGKRLPMHVKFDTGLSRFGFSEKEMEPFFDILSRSEFVFVQGLYTHFAQSQLDDQSYTDQQEAYFNRLVDYCVERIGNVQFIHAYNSAATLLRNTNQYNFFRVGLALYGYYSSEFLRLVCIEKSDLPQLIPILTLQSHIIQIKKIKKDSFIGYNCEFQASHNMVIGLVPFGYYDGYEPCFMNNASVVVNNQKCPVIGRIAMNIIIINITHINNPAIGMIVFLIDSSRYPADFLCKAAGISNVRSFLCRLNYLIERRLSD